jgi:aminoglycoside/choline kinase family phosphotransferase
LVSERIKYPQLEKLFKKHFGENITNTNPLSSHGSDRQIIRIWNGTGKTFIGIINENLGENKAFLNFSLHFRKYGLNVPEIYCISDDNKSYIMEDLGDTTLFNKINARPGGSFRETEIDLYKSAINELLKFQIEAGNTLDYSYCYQYPEFGKENIEQDLKYFKQRFLINFYKSTLDENRLNTELDIIKGYALEVPRIYFLYRDFQSRNIMLKNDELYFIDYQSGRKGALQYDLASLLYDAKANIPQTIRELLTEYYIVQAKKYIRIDEEEFRNHFWYFALIRILQAMGAYGYLGIVKGKTNFLESIPFALKNINFILENKINDKKLSYIKKIFQEINYDT